MSSRVLNSRRLAATVSAAVLALGTGILAQSAQSKAVESAVSDASDADFAKAVREWTTRPEFMSPLVDHLPKAAGIPTPKDVLGYYIGAPKRLTHVADIGRYY